ncbi:hypothetical protein Q4Q34_08615 [Flavivirga abyssicola]|uniref:hypothetical protein n=1 Tax=Flavivirga abyssicola TaxID=3063533 RepID=UPI0026DFCCEB|nr:hypothetical protein [Flavivirga sp. MEBiC07777]WVK15089.1 hypothetical protein Q4Q34_08615 [Flavivirga sp. MEBiC07777]
MTDNTKQTQKKGKRPTHTVFVETRIHGKPHNIKIGAAWKHSKGDGFNISLNNMVVFENKAKDETPNTQS